MLDQSTYTPRLKAEYASRVRAALKEEFGYKNDMQIPRLDKIVLNMGIGEAVKDTKKVKQGAEELSLIVLKVIAPPLDAPPAERADWGLNWTMPRISLRARMTDERLPSASARCLRCSGITWSRCGAAGAAARACPACPSAATGTAAGVG